MPGINPNQIGQFRTGQNQFCSRRSGLVDGHDPQFGDGGVARPGDHVVNEDYEWSLSRSVSVKAITPEFNFCRLNAAARGVRRFTRSVNAMPF
jgi:hypothetical protein